MLAILSNLYLVPRRMYLQTKMNEVHPMKSRMKFNFGQNFIKNRVANFVESFEAKEHSNEPRECA